jgi:RNA polymerase sigma factor (sigma-70 family)
MARSHIGEVIQHLRMSVLLRDGAGLTDGQLLSEYIARREEAVLAVLVRRHGPMVWSACRRILRNYHDAEDAFQATFLVLVRKAASIVPREMVANWLYGVAHQTALKARATASKRKGRERQVTEMPEPVIAEQRFWRDLQPVLDEELSRLPDKYRSVIVLCDLECRTRKEAARQIGCPEGTVAGRLARARVMLAKRLARHGLIFSGGALGTVLSQNLASAFVPISVVSFTIKAASLMAAGPAAGVISVEVAALMEGVLKTMSLTKSKIAMTLLLVVFVLTLGTATVLPRTSAQDQPKDSIEGNKNVKIKWEYKALTRSEVDTLGLKKLRSDDAFRVNRLAGGLNALGNEGWELAAIEPVQPGSMPFNQQAIYVFKRERN